MLEMNHKEMDAILVQINQAVDNHDQWHRQLIRTLVCNLPPDERDIAENAHTLCRFGQWYYNYSKPELRDHPTFVAMENEHRQLHELVGKLLRISMGDTRIDPLLYDRFANTLERMRLQLFSLKHEIESELYNLDPLTGAYTRYSMLAALREQQELVVRSVASCAIAMLDIDQFKLVNDRNGHQAGDYALSQIASMVIKNLRPYDKLYRYGGDEFIIMLPDTQVDTAQEIAERMRKLIENTSLRIDDRSLDMTVSIGISSIYPDRSVELSVEEADRAMYAAKQDGRNMVRLWDASLAGG